ncbi:GGDEF domain-containing protein [Gilvimarinus chinensis]|uniref:GGDEF domain-containing protein n=1 Tax=Gilvimarinus chinensis TaxID=396005 RepID=UPI00037CFFEB|nr:GGDEF domain-containing protein [Gilvimarinus chinensis]
MSQFSQAMLTLLGILLACLLWAGAGFAGGDIQPSDQLQPLYVVCDALLTAVSFLLLAIFCFAPIKRSLATVLVAASALIFMSAWHTLLSNLVYSMPAVMALIGKCFLPLGLGGLTLGIYRLIKTYRLSRLLLGSYRKIEHSLSTRDQLTQLFNRRYFYTSCSELLNSCQAQGEPCSLITFIVRNLADINARYGIQAGDAVLSESGLTLLRNTRQQDIASRLGGRKLTLFLPNTKAQDALPVAQRLESALSNAHLTQPVEQTITLQIEWNIQQSATTDSLEALVERNEAALSRAA